MILFFFFFKATADYEELPGKVRNKCEGKEIFKGGYKFLSQEQYEESMETENFIGDSQSSTNLERTKRGSPQCMREVTFEILNQDNEILIAA